jgi:hypothetical protein
MEWVMSEPVNDQSASGPVQLVEDEDLKNKKEQTPFLIGENKPNQEKEASIEQNAKTAVNFDDLQRMGFEGATKALKEVKFRPFVLVADPDNKGDVKKDKNGAVVSGTIVFDSPDWAEKVKNGNKLSEADQKQRESEQISWTYAEGKVVSIEHGSNATGVSQVNGNIISVKAGNNVQQLCDKKADEIKVTQAVAEAVVSTQEVPIQVDKPKSVSTQTQSRQNDAIAARMPQRSQVHSSSGGVNPSVEIEKVRYESYRQVSNNETSRDVAISHDQVAISNNSVVSKALDHMADMTKGVMSLMSQMISRGSSATQEMEVVSENKALSQGTKLIPEASMVVDTPVAPQNKADEDMRRALQAVLDKEQGSKKLVKPIQSREEPITKKEKADVLADVLVAFKDKASGLGGRVGSTATPNLSVDNNISIKK